MVSERGEPNPEDTCSVLAHEGRGGLDRESGLTCSSRSRERDKARSSLDPRDDLGELSLTTEEGARRAREVRVRNGLERREAFLPELEERDRLGDVLEPMFPEIGQLCLDELGGRRRDDDLATMTRRRNPGGEVDVVSDVALVSEE